MKTFRIQLLLTILILPCLAADCQEKGKAEDWPQRLPTTQMTIATQSFTLEIANDAKEREIGLMKRDSIPADYGMIFVFPDETPRSFWMKNTRIDLDILYVRSDGVIDSIATMRAYDLTGVSSKGPAKYAIELNSGIASKIGVKPGDHLDIPEVAKDTKE
jgi:uncharacterized membrane protein (UPF0127 family)